MKRLIISTFLLTIFPFSLAQAVIDPEPDRIGIYFDQNADISDHHAPELVPFFAYVIITNPTQSGISGYEFGYKFTTRPDQEPNFLRLVVNLPQGALDSGDSDSVFQGDYVILLAEPLPVNIATVLLTWQFILLEYFPVDLFLEAGVNSEHGYGFPSYNVGDEIYGLDISGACGFEADWIPSAYINSWCPLPVESTLFGSVKSLYR